MSTHQHPDRGSESIAKQLNRSLESSKRLVEAYNRTIGKRSSEAISKRTECEGRDQRKSD